MTTINFEKNKKEALKNLVCDKKQSDTHTNTIINGKNLNTNANLSLEYINLYGIFVYDVGESFPIVKYDKFKAMFSDLREALELYMETKEYNKKALKRIMVHLGLELGTDIRFTDEFQQMLSENLLEKDYSDLQENFTFENLYHQYAPKRKPNKRSFTSAILKSLYQTTLEIDFTYHDKTAVGVKEFSTVQKEDEPQTRGKGKR